MPNGAGIGSAIGSTGLLAEGAVGSAAGVPWAVILPIAVSLIGSLLGGDSEAKEQQQRQENLTGTLNALRQAGFSPPYQSQMLPVMDPTIAQALLNNYSRLSNWGYPEGMGMDTSFIENALSSIAGSSSPALNRRIQL